MFGLNKKIEVEKFCEFCGSLVKAPYYTVLFSVTHIINGSNSLVANIDRKNQNIKLKNGEIYDYTFEVDPGTFAAANLSSEHLLCSEKCEDNFIKKYFNVYDKDQQPVYDYKQMNVFNPIAIPSIRIGGEKRKCSFCGNEYKFNGRNWIKVPLIRSIKVRGVYNLKPEMDIQKYNLILSGLSENNPNGDWFGYATDNSKSVGANYCSYDCAYEVVKSEEVIILVNSVMDKDRLGAIVKETELFNKMLGNPIHRPSFFQPIPS